MDLKEQEQILKEGKDKWDTLNNLNLNELGSEYLFIKSKIEDLERNLKVLKFFIMKHMKPIKFYRDDNCVITLSSITRKTLDKKKVAEYLSTTVIESCIKTSTFDILRVMSITNYDRIKNLLKKDEQK